MLSAFVAVTPVSPSAAKPSAPAAVPFRKSRRVNCLLIFCFPPVSYFSFGKIIISQKSLKRKIENVMLAIRKT